MNKLMKKILGLTLGLTMAIGAGVAIGSSREAVPAKASSTGTYALVTSTTGIAAGDTVIIVNHAGNQALKSISTSSTKYGTLGSVSVSNSKITLSSASVAELVVRTGSGGTGFAFEGTSTNDAGGGTAIANGKYLTWTSGNSLNIATSISANSSFTLDSYSADNGMTIANCSTTTRLLRYNNGSGQERFACYTSSTGTLVDIYKKEVAQKYTVSFDANNAAYTGSTPSALTQSTAGAAITLPVALSCTGYTWLGWNTSSSGGQSTRKTAGSSYTPSSSHTLYGEWQINSYTVDGNGITNGSIAPTSNVSYGTEYSGTITPATNYTCPDSLTVTMGGNTLVVGTDYLYDNTKGTLYIGSVTGNLVISGACVPEGTAYTVTYNANSGTVSPASEQIIENGHPSFPIPTRSGYNFKGWQVNGSGTAYTDPEEYTVTGDVTFVASWVVLYTVSFNSNGGSSSPSSMQVEDGKMFSFPSAGTKTHYTFSGWSSDNGTTKYAVGAESPAVTANIEYTAYWTEDAKYIVTYKAGPNGLGEFPDPGIYAGSYTLKKFTELTGVSANSGYRFKNYTVAGVEKNAGDSITISEAIEVTVNFEVMPRVDTLNRDFTGVSDGATSYTAWTGKTGASGAVYAGESAGSNNSIQLRATSPSGIITTTSGGTVKKIIVVWESHSASERTIDIYGKNSAYTETGNLYASDEATKGTKLGSIVYGTSTELTVTGDYEYIGIRSNKSALYLSEIQIEWEAPNQLSSIALSGDYKTSFASGETFSFGGIVTAKYTKASDANVTSSATFHLDSASGTSMSGVKLTHASHDGHTIYVKYTENDITKTATYEISVANAPVSSVTIETHAAGIGFKEDYSIEDITPTVLPADAVQTTEWVVSANTVSNDYTWNGTKLTSGETQGTITLRCRSTADNNKYDELVVTVTGDPVVDITPASVSGYVGKSVDVDFTYGNIDNEELINFASSDESVFTVGEDIEIDGEGAVTIYFEGAGSATLSASYNGGSTLDSITVTVSADSVTDLSWSAPTIKVYSGATTTVSDASSWNVHYTMASGGGDDLSYGEYTLKLGGSAITLPHTWDASEDGEVLSIEYGGFASPTTSTVDVTQSLRPVNVPVPGEESTKTWTANAAADFGSKIGSVNGTDSGSVTFNNGSTMSYERTLEFLNSGSADYLALSSNYIQFGSSNALEKLVLTAATSGTVTSVVVDCWAKNGGSNISVTVGGNAFDSSKACPSAGAKVTFNGSATGTVVITMEKSTKTAGLAQYIKSVAITTAEDSGETTNIANVAGHEAAQKAVVKFAKAFNTALGATENCTTGLDAAWSKATTAWSTFNSDIASLSADEQTYAKNLIKYATAQHTKDTDDNFEYCLERAMATYEICVTKHGKDAFMNDVRSASPVVNKNILESMTSGSTIAIVVVSVFAVTAIGGYFFIRKRKELN